MTDEGKSIGNGQIQVMHELTVEGYRITVFNRENGEFVMSWCMDPLEALEFGQTMTRTIAEHYTNVINILKEHHDESGN